MIDEIKKSVIWFLVPILLIVLTIILRTTNRVDKDDIDMYASIATMIATYLVFVQLREGKKTSDGQFILDLQNTYNDNNYFTTIFNNCWNCIDGKKVKKKPYINKEELIKYLTFFEGMNIMLEKGIINIKTLDELFGRRFFAVVNHKQVQDNELVQNYKYYGNIYRLYACWIKYRLKHKKELIAVGEKKDIKEEKDEKVFCDLQRAILNKIIPEKKMKKELTRKQKEELKELRIKVEKDCSLKRKRNTYEDK